MTRESIFGTDGIRGRAGEGWLTPASAVAVGRAAGTVLGSAGAVALLGHDGRASGPQIEAFLAYGLEQAGLSVVSAGRITTPGLAWLARTGDFALGAMISASHNPAEDNGIKLFSDIGGKLADAEQEAIEDLLHADPRDEEPDSSPVESGTGLLDRYLDHLVADACPGLVLDGLEVVVDCANGGGSSVAPQVLSRLGARVTAIAASPDGLNINRSCGSTHPEALQAAVLESGAAIGIALDGDGDRCILVDERGELVHGDGIMTVVARHAVAAGEYEDPRIVATVMSNRGLHRALKDVGVGIHEVVVGDRAVVEGMRQEGLMLGGEQSGHIVFGEDGAFIGDGTHTALRVLRVMAETREGLSALASPYKEYPQVLLNVPVATKPPLESLALTGAAVAAVEAELGDEGRVLLRYSGTENLARVMVEGPESATIQAAAERIAATLEVELQA